MKVKVTYYEKDSNGRSEKKETTSLLPMRIRYGSYNEPVKSTFADGFSVTCGDVITVEIIEPI